jgi:5'-nucleotidase
MKTIMSMLPYPDPILVVKISGKTFKEALENGVSFWPSYDGRWPFISGVTFSFDPSKPLGKRINFEDIMTLSGPLDQNMTYTLAVKEFIAYGKDGYESISEGTI